MTRIIGLIGLWAAVLGTVVGADWIQCEGDYEFHLQGVPRDDSGNLYWSFTTEIVKTTAEGEIITKVAAPNHQGDLCYRDGRIYVAVNLGEFNQPAGRADSWVYVFDATSLEFLERHATPEVVHGAGGMDFKDGRFFVVGGLPAGWIENYVYEYTPEFDFVQRHVIASGWTSMGIQTAAWHDGQWWFGCYGEVRTLLTTDADFRLTGRFLFDCSLGIVGVSPGRLLIADGPKTPEGRCLGRVRWVKPDPLKGLVALETQS
jgi:hypothetical protein